MKLELRHLAPYLPYGVKMIFEKSGDIRVLNGLFIELGELRFHFNVINRGQTIWNYKPILRPLSDLTKEIEVNGKRFIPIDIMNEYSDLECVPSLLSDNPDALYFSNNDDKIYLTDIYPNHISKLFEWHFDVFNLIENNLAIDINTLK